MVCWLGGLLDPCLSHDPQRFCGACTLADLQALIDAELAKPKGKRRSRASEARAIERYSRNYGQTGRPAARR